MEELQVIDEILNQLYGYDTIFNSQDSELIEAKKREKIEKQEEMSNQINLACTMVEKELRQQMGESFFEIKKGLRAFVINAIQKEINNGNTVIDVNGKIKPGKILDIVNQSKGEILNPLIDEENNNKEAKIEIDALIEEKIEENTSYEEVFEQLKDMGIDFSEEEKEYIKGATKRVESFFDRIESQMESGMTEEEAWRIETEGMTEEELKQLMIDLNTVGQIESLRLLETLNDTSEKKKNDEKTPEQSEGKTQEGGSKSSGIKDQDPKRIKDHLKRIHTAYGIIETSLVSRSESPISYKIVKGASSITGKYKSKEYKPVDIGDRKETTQYVASENFKMEDMDFAPIRANFKLSKAITQLTTVTMEGDHHVYDDTNLGVDGRTTNRYANGELSDIIFGIEDMMKMFEHVYEKEYFTPNDAIPEKEQDDVTQPKTIEEDKSKTPEFISEQKIEEYFNYKGAEMTAADLKKRLYEQSSTGEAHADKDLTTADRIKLETIETEQRAFFPKDVKGAVAKKAQMKEIKKVNDVLIDEAKIEKALAESEKDGESLKGDGTSGNTDTSKEFDE